MDKTVQRVHYGAQCYDFCEESKDNTGNVLTFRPSLQRKCQKFGMSQLEKKMRKQ